MIKDIFDKFEIRVWNWVRDRSFLWIIPLKIIVIWIVFCLALASMSGIVGFNMVSNNITEQYDAGLYPQESYDFWQTIIIPVAVQAFNTISVLIFTIVGMYIIFMLYLLVRTICRRNTPIE